MRPRGPPSSIRCSPAATCMRTNPLFALPLGVLRPPGLFLSRLAKLDLLIHERPHGPGLMLLEEISRRGQQRRQRGQFSKANRVLEPAFDRALAPEGAPSWSSIKSTCISPLIDTFPGASSRRLSNTTIFNSRSPLFSLGLRDVHRRHRKLFRSFPVLNS